MKVWRGIFVLCAGVGSWSMAAVDLKEAEITTIKNIVEHDPGTGAAPAKVNEKIHEKSKVSTAASSMAELTFADSSITRMGANTQFSFRSKERLVKLDQGTILIHTPPGNGGATVEAGGVTAAVSGTTFMASRDGVGNVLFVLLEGQGGLKVTAGGSSTVIRPGQAASVGADSVKESPGVASSEKGPASPAAGPSASPGEEKGPGGSPAAGGGDSGGTPPPAAPKIQVFDIDVKRVVTTSPLVMDFQGELPSSAKIEKTIETQQQAVKEGKLEKLEVEAVAVKSTDGDLLVGAPKVEKEEFVVVNKKLDIVGKSTGGDGLDIDTAAGPGAGSGTGGGVAAAPAPRVETPTAPPAVTPPVNPGQTALQPPPAATTVAVIARVNDASRPFGQDNPSFGFSLTSGSLLAGHSLVTDFLTSATRSSGVSASPFAVDFSNPKIVDSSGADVSSRYDLTTLPGVLNVVKAGQSVTFGSVGSLTFGQSVDLVASAFGGNVGFEVVSGPASVVNGKLVATSGTGEVVIRASTPGNENYLGAAAEQTITLAKAGQSVNFGSVGGVTFGQSVDLVGSALGGAVNYEVVSGPATVVNGKLVATSGTGEVVVRASTPGNENYLGADAVQTITLAKAGQSVNFGSVGSLTFGQSVDLVGSALGGAVNYEVVSGPGTVVDGKLVATSGTGDVVIRASTPGNENYLGADAVQTITLAKAGQSVNFGSVGGVTFGQSVDLVGSALGGAVNYEVVSGPGTVVDGKLVATSGTGDVVIRASTPGNENYLGAAAEQTITLAKAGQSVNFGSVGGVTFGQSVDLVGSALGGAVNYEVVSGPATVVDGKLVATSGTGEVVVRASTPGNENYLGADAVQTITLAKAGQSVSFTPPSSLTYNTSTGLSATALGSGAVSFSIISGPATIDSNGRVVATSGTGSVIIRAIALGDSNYKESFQDREVVLAKADQLVSEYLVPPTSLTYGGVGIALNQSLLGKDGNRVSFDYEIINSSGASFLINPDGTKGAVVANSGTGTITLRASVSETPNLKANTQDFIIALEKAVPNLIFSSLPNGAVYGLSYNLFGNAETPVTYEVLSGPGSVVGGKTFIPGAGTGEVIIRATATGDSNYKTTYIDQKFVLRKGTMPSYDLGSFPTLPLVFNDEFELGVGKDPILSGRLSYELVNPQDSSKVLLDGSKIRALSGIGGISLRLKISGDDNYEPTELLYGFSLAKAGPTLTPQKTGSTANGDLVASLGGQFGGEITFSALGNDGRVVVDSATGAISLGRTLADSATLRVTTAGNDNYLTGFADLTVPLAGPTLAQREAANSARRLLTGPGSSAELEALDKFFYYTAKAADYAGDAPSGFFATDHQSKNLTFGQVESARLSQLYAGQTSDYFFMGNLNAGNVGVPEMNLQGRDRIIYADTVRIDPTVGADRTLGETFSKGPAIPDGNPAGLARTLDLSSRGLTGSFSWFVDQVSLRIDGDPMAYGAFNGDFNSYLRHTKSSGETATVDLLDRMGSTVTEPEGSASNGLDVTFRDFASTAIHDADSAQAGGAIEGTYQPDRGVNPLTAGIGPVDPSGQFTLAVFDASSGAEGVLHSWSIDLVERFAISLENGAATNFTLAAGDGGLFMKNTFWDLGGTRAEFTTTGNLSLQSDSFFFPGSSLKMEAAGSAELADVGVLGNPTAGSEVVIRARQDVTLTDTAIHEVGGQIEVASLNGAVELLASKTIGTQTVSGNVDLQAEGKIKITGATPVEIDMSAGVGSGGTSSPAAGNLAVVRSGDSLELRNVVIRGFSGARLENNAGRVLMSGSSVRDFKIKELVGAAVNADSKIQMAALDAQGGLGGEMLVEKGLPVAKASVAASTSLQAKLGSTELAEIMNDPQRRDVQLDAGQVDLAARKITFDNASVAALNSITARANTILVQNSFMTVVQNSGMINMYVSTGLVNRTYGGPTLDGYLNFAGAASTFRIGNVLNLTIADSNGILNAINSGQMLENVSTPQEGKVNVLKL